MRRIWMVALVVACVTALVAPAAAGASAVRLTASPNPARVGQKVVHSVDVAAGGRLEIWVSAVGFGQPRNGTLPPGTWSQTCCPSQTAGTSAWYFRSSGSVSPGRYRFGTDARRAGSHLSTAVLGYASSGIWIRVQA